MCCEKKIRIKKMVPKTVIYDIDGLLVEHPGTNWDGKRKLKTLPGVIEQNQKDIDRGNFIIVMTARKKNLEKETIEQLKQIPFHYDHLIMGVTSGQRILYNDHKPIFGIPVTYYEPSDFVKKQRVPYKTAIGITVVRDTGLKNIEEIEKQQGVQYVI